LHQGLCTTKDNKEKRQYLKRQEKFVEGHSKTDVCLILQNIAFYGSKLVGHKKSVYKKAAVRAAKMVRNPIFR
jgi:hypothetical protein